MGHDGDLDADLADLGELVLVGVVVGDQLVDLVEKYSKAQGMFRTDDAPEPEYDELLELDLATVVPSVAGPRLDDLVDGLDRSVSWLETTITADNEASIRLFCAFARSRGAEVVREPLFESYLFPDGHAGWMATGYDACRARVPRYL